MFYTPVISGADVACDIIRFILTHHKFEFNDRHFSQTQITTMETIMASTNTSIFMDTLEQELRCGYHLESINFWRYVNNIFFRWRQSEAFLRDFNTHINYY